MIKTNRPNYVADRLNRLCAELGIEVERVAPSGEKNSAVKLYLPNGDMVYFTSASYALRMLSFVKELMEERIKQREFQGVFLSEPEHKLP